MSEYLDVLLSVLSIEELYRIRYRIKKKDRMDLVEILSEAIERREEQEMPCLTKTPL